MRACIDGSVSEPCQHGPRAHCSPSVAQLVALLVSLRSTGLWKLGSCFERLLDRRTHDAAHYNPKYFNRDGAICVAYGIASKVLAATLESTGIQYLKYTLRVGVNSKDSDDVPHGGYSAFDLAALYLVPLVARITTQAQFFQEHVSYYLMNKQGITKLERKLAKRAAKLAELMELIPPRELSRAFQHVSSPYYLWKLQAPRGINKSRVDIYQDLREMYWHIFAEPTIADDASGETTEEDEEEDYYIPAYHGEYDGLTGVLPDGTAVLDFSTLPPVSSFVRLNPNWAD